MFTGLRPHKKNQSKTQTISTKKIISHLSLYLVIHSIFVIMAGRGSCLLPTDFTHDEFSPNPPLVVGRAVLWPLPRPENKVYHSDLPETPPISAPSPTSVIQPNGRVMAVAPSVWPLVPRPAAPSGQAPSDQLASLPGSSCHPDSK